MPKPVETLLAALKITPNWVTFGFVDIAFVAEVYAALSTHDAEHLRLKLYTQFFDYRRGEFITDDDIKKYLKLTHCEIDKTLKSWAIECLIESDLLSKSQIVSLCNCALLEQKHRFFLEREIEEA